MGWDGMGNLDGSIFGANKCSKYVSHKLCLEDSQQEKNTKIGINVEVLVLAFA